MADTDRVQVKVRMTEELHARVKAAVSRKRIELAKVGLRPEAWSASDQIVEFIEQGLRGGKGRG